MPMTSQEFIDQLVDDFDEIGQIMKDFDKIKELVGCGTTDNVDPDSAQTKFIELLLVIGDHQESYGHEALKDAARKWLTENVSGLGDFDA